MLPPYKRSKPNPFVAPRAIRRLPLNSMRDALVTRDPSRAAKAMEEYYRYMSGAEMPALLPQRMAFQQHKTPQYGGVGHDSAFGDWLTSTQSWAALVSQYTHGVPNRIAHIQPPAPRYPIHAAAATRGMNMMPQPPTHMTPVVARTVRVNDATSSMVGRAEPPPGAWILANEVTQARHRRVRLLQHEAAMFGARAAVVRSRGYMK